MEVKIISNRNIWILLYIYRAYQYYLPLSIPPSPGPRCPKVEFPPSPPPPPSNHRGGPLLLWSWGGGGKGGGCGKGNSGRVQGEWGGGDTKRRTCEDAQWSVPGPGEQLPVTACVQVRHTDQARCYLSHFLWPSHLPSQPLVLTVLL